MIGEGVADKVKALKGRKREIGVDILKGLQTVQRALRLEDVRAIPLVAVNVVRNEQNNPEFSRYAREQVGYEVPDQCYLVEALLEDVFLWYEEQLAAEAAALEAAEAAALEVDALENELVSG